METIIVDPEMLTICRMCVDQKGMFQILPSLQKEIKECFNIKVEPFDGLSQIICVTCKLLINEFYSLKNTFREKQALLLQKSTEFSQKSITDKSNQEIVPQQRIRNTAVKKNHSSNNGSATTLSNNWSPGLPQQQRSIQILRKESTDLPITGDIYLVNSSEEDSLPGLVSDDVLHTRRDISRLYYKYHCIYCSKTYFKKSQLKRHRDTLHPNLVHLSNLLTKDCRVSLTKLDSNLSANSSWVQRTKEQITRFDWNHRHQYITQHRSGRVPSETASEQTKDLFGTPEKDEASTVTNGVVNVAKNDISRSPVCRIKNLELEKIQKTSTNGATTKFKRIRRISDSDDDSVFELPVLAVQPNPEKVNADPQVRVSEHQHPKQPFVTNKKRIALKNLTPTLLNYSLDRISMDVDWITSSDSIIKVFGKKLTKQERQCRKNSAGIKGLVPYVPNHINKATAQLRLNLGRKPEMKEAECQKSTGAVSVIQPLSIESVSTSLPSTVENLHNSSLSDNMPDKQVSFPLLSLPESLEHDGISSNLPSPSQPLFHLQVLTSGHPQPQTLPNLSSHLPPYSPSQPTSHPPSQPRPRPPSHPPPRPPSHPPPCPPSHPLPLPPSQPPPHPPSHPQLYQLPHLPPHPTSQTQSHQSSQLSPSPPSHLPFHPPSHSQLYPQLHPRPHPSSQTPPHPSSQLSSCPPSHPRLYAPSHLSPQTLNHQLTQRPLNRTLPPRYYPRHPTMPHLQSHLSSQLPPCLPSHPQPHPSPYRPLHSASTAPQVMLSKTTNPQIPRFLSNEHVLVTTSCIAINNSAPDNETSYSVPQPVTDLHINNEKSNSFIEDVPVIVETISLSVPRSAPGKTIKYTKKRSPPPASLALPRIKCKPTSTLMPTQSWAASLPHNMWPWTPMEATARMWVTDDSDQSVISRPFSLLNHTLMSEERQTEPADRPLGADNRLLETDMSLDCPDLTGMLTCVRMKVIEVLNSGMCNLRSVDVPITGPMQPKPYEALKSGLFACGLRVDEKLKGNCSFSYLASLQVVYRSVSLVGVDNDRCYAVVVFQSGDSIQIQVKDLRFRSVDVNSWSSQWQCQLIRCLRMPIVGRSILNTSKSLPYNATMKIRTFIKFLHDFNL